ncbi:MAG: D-alanine--D-alanine ligase [Clostridiales bacterium]|nr:D-alanine--D-alanine ligase [Clostridiales bacterium]
MMSKKVVAVIFGGKSSEHEISKISATFIMRNMSENKYRCIPIYITKNGEWKLYDGSIDNIVSGNWESYAATCILSPSTEHKGLFRIVGDKIKNIPVDVIFPVLHGKGGEDGTIQGLFEMANIPYVGCGVLASAVSMDKSYTKIIAEKVNIPQAKYIVTHRYELENMENILNRVEKKLDYPCFIKPSRAGSSVGVTKAHNREEAEKGILLAAENDLTIIIEECISGREFETAVLGNCDIQVSCVGEVLAADEFYSYDAKYNNSESQTVIPADLPEKTSEKIRKYAAKIYKALDCRGLSRADFFVRDNGDIIFNEINTIPGFTPISMYPMLFKAIGIDTAELIDRLIETALPGEER